MPMLSLKLCNDRTEVDLDRLAQAFSIGRTDLEDRLREGTVRYWHEVSGSDHDIPRMVFRSTETGRRVMLDGVGEVASIADEGPKPSRRQQPPRHVGYADASAPRARLELLLDEALRGTFPASDPIAVGVETDRLVA
jgi:hypothetical protein